MWAVRAENYSKDLSQIEQKFRGRRSFGVGEYGVAIEILKGDCGGNQGRVEDGEVS